MRALVLAAFIPSIASGELAPDIEDRPTERSVLSQVAVPCLREKDEQRYVVSWEIRNTVTGERLSVGSQEVRLRC